MGTRRDPPWRHDEQARAQQTAGEAEDPGALRAAHACPDTQEPRSLEAKLLAAQKLESLGMLAGGIAHDFNNIVLSILTNASMVLDAMPPDAPHRPCVEDIEHAGRRAADLCRQLLAYAGRGRFIVEPLDVSSLVEGALRLVRSSIPRGAIVRSTLTEGLPGALGDATQLRQVVMNLILNAAEALPGGAGEIRLRTGATTCGAAELAGAVLGEELPEGPYVYVEVKDTGVGMDEETRRQVFEPFFSTKFAGRGLGLAATIGTMRAHRGAIHLDTAPGQGSTFRLLLPAQSAPAPRSARPASPLPPAATRSRVVLLVDDEPLVRTAGRRLLERAGLQVLEAEDGASAAALLAASPRVEAAIVDLTMPGISGEATLRELRRIRPALPVILTSGWDENEVTDLLQEAPGLTAFLQKPWSLAELNERLAAVLRAGGGGPP